MENIYVGITLIRGFYVNDIQRKFGFQNNLFGGYWGSNKKKFLAWSSDLYS
jgi:hypothetical protein